MKLKGYGINSRLFQQQAFFFQASLLRFSFPGSSFAQYGRAREDLGNEDELFENEFFERLQNLWITAKFRFGGKKLDVCLYQIYGHLLNIKFFCFFFMNY